MIDKYPHHFSNFLRINKDKTRNSTISFPNEGTTKGGLVEFPVLRSPQGQAFGVDTVLKKNPDRVVSRLDAWNTVTFMGLMSHAESQHQGYKYDFLFRNIITKKNCIWYVISQRWTKNMLLYIYLLLYSEVLGKC